MIVVLSIWQIQKILVWDQINHEQTTLPPTIWKKTTLVLSNSLEGTFTIPWFKKQNYFVKIIPITSEVIHRNVQG